jgi:hypothetical protein
MKIAPVLDLLTFGPLRKYHSMQAEIAGKAMAGAAKSGKRGTFIYEFDPIVTLAAERLPPDLRQLLTAAVSKRHSS